MVFDSIKKKAAEALGNEGQTDSALEAAEKLASEKTGGKYDDKIAQGRDIADGKVGDEYGAAA